MASRYSRVHVRLKLYSSFVLTTPYLRAHRPLPPPSPRAEIGVDEARKGRDAAATAVGAGSGWQEHDAARALVGGAAPQPQPRGWCVT